MPEYPAISRLHHCLLHLAQIVIFFVFRAASLSCLNEQWMLTIILISDFEMKSAGGIPGTLFEDLILAWMLLKVHLWHLPLDSVAGV